MGKNQTVEELLQELEDRLQSVGGRLDALRRESRQLGERVHRLEQRQAAAVKKINQMLDRIDALG